MCLDMTKDQSDQFDLGFSINVTDTCDYFDYSDLEINKRPERNKFTVMQLNVRGVLKKQDALK